MIHTLTRNVRLSQSDAVKVATFVDRKVCEDWWEKRRLYDGGWVGFLAGKGNAEGGNKHRMHSTQEDCQCKTAASEICVSLGVHIYS